MRMHAPAAMRKKVIEKPPLAFDSEVVAIAAAAPPVTSAPTDGEETVAASDDDAPRKRVTPPPVRTASARVGAPSRSSTRVTAVVRFAVSDTPVSALWMAASDDDAFFDATAAAEAAATLEELLGAPADVSAAFSVQSGSAASATALTDTDVVAESETAPVSARSTVRPSLATVGKTVTTMLAPSGNIPVAINATPTFVTTTPSAPAESAAASAHAPASAPASALSIGTAFAGTAAVTFVLKIALTLRTIKILAVVVSIREGVGDSDGGGACCVFEGVCDCDGCACNGVLLPVADAAFTNALDDADAPPAIGLADSDAPATDAFVLLADSEGVTRNEDVVDGDAPSDRDDVGVTV